LTSARGDVRARDDVTSPRLDLSPPVNDTARPLSTTTTTAKTKPPKVAEARHLERRHATPRPSADVNSVIAATIAVARAGERALSRSADRGTVTREVLTEGSVFNYSSISDIFRLNP